MSIVVGSFLPEKMLIREIYSRYRFQLSDFVAICLIMRAEQQATVGIASRA